MADTEKNVMFVLGVQVSEQAKQALEKFSRDIVSAQNRAMQSAKKTAEEQAKSIIAAHEKANGALQRTLDQRTKAHSNALNAEKQREQQLADDKIKMHRSASEAVAAIVVQNNRQAMAQVSADTDKATEKSVAAYNAMSLQARQATREVAGAFFEAGASAMQFARGLTALGLVGEKDLDKVKDALLSAQGTLDVFAGAGKVLVKFDQISMGITKTLEARRKAQEALNAATAAGAAIEVAASAGPMGKIGRAASGAGTSIAGAAQAVLPAGVVSGVGGGAMGGIAVLGAAAAAVGGVLFGTVSAIASFREALTHGIGGGAKSGGMVEAIGTSGWNPYSAVMKQETIGDKTWAAARRIPLIGAAASALGIDTRTGTERREDAQTARLKQKDANAANRAQMDAADAERINAAESARTTALARQAQITQAMQEAKLDAMRTDERRKAIALEIANAEKAIANGSESGREDLIRWQERRLANEREIATTQRTAAVDALNSAKQQLDAIKTRIDAEREAMQTAKESFGLMNADKQAQLVDLKKRLNAGDQTLTAEELQSLRGINDTTDKQVAAIADKRANEAGFGVFADENAKQMQGLEEAKRKIEMDVQQKMDVVVKIDTDIDALAKQIAEQINAQNQAMLGSLTTKIEENAKAIAEANARMARRAQFPQ